MKKTVISLILVFVLCLSSCGVIVINRNEETAEHTLAVTDTADTEEGYTLPPPVTYHDYEPDANKKLDDLESTDLDGLSIFLTADTECVDLFDVSEGLYRNSAIRRNNAVALKYNCKLIFSYEDDLFDGVEKAAKSEDFYTDFVVDSISDVGKYVTAKNMIRELRSLPFADFDSECFNREAMEKVSPSGKLYAAIGYATDTLESLGCVYINTDIVGEIDYGMVESGGFTVEKLIEMTREAAMTSSLGDSGFCSALFEGMGKEFVSSSGSYTKEYLEDAVNGIASLFGKTSFESNGIFEMNNGLSAVHVGNIGTMRQLAGTRWEVLPMPKLNEGDAYLSPVTSSQPVIMVSEASKGIETMGVILQALFTASEKYIMNSFYDEAQRNFITSGKTLDMIELISEKPLYSTIMMYSSLPKVANASTSALLEAVKKGDEKYMRQAFDAGRSKLFSTIK